MFEVSAVADFYVIVRVTFRALEDMEVSQPEVRVGEHAATVGKRTCRFHAGQTITLTFPGWRDFRIGDRVPLARIIKHPGLGRFVTTQRL
jgi:hypothetical protein